MSSTLLELRTTLDKQKGRKEGYEQDLTTENERLIVKKNRLITVEASAALIKQISNKMNSKIGLSLTDITQAMIDSVFPGMYKVKLDFAIKNNRTHVDIYLDMDGEKIYPLDDDGGGIANMMELGLRIAALQLGRSRKTLVLDQPFKDLSKEFLPVGAQILKKIADDLGIQLIIINHIPELMDIADHTLQVSKNYDTGISTVKVKD